MTYPDSLPELIKVEKLIYLPYEVISSGYGSLVFLFTNSIEDSIRVLKSRPNFYDMNRFKHYFYPLEYRGKIYNKKYRIRDINKRKLINEKIQKEVGLIPVPTKTLPKNFQRNIYVDLSTYLNIFSTLSTQPGLQPAMVMRLFWQYFSSIVNGQLFANYTGDAKKMVLIPLDQKFSFNGKLRDLIHNPIYLFYYTLYKDFSVCKDVDMDFLFYAGKSCMRWNPSHSTKDSYKEFKTQIRLLLNKIQVDMVIDDQELDNEDALENIKSGLSEKYNFVGNSEDGEITSLDGKDASEKKKQTEETEKKKEEKIKKAVDKAVATSDSKDVSEIAKKAAEELEQDREFIEEMYKATMKERLPKSPACSARDAKIKAEQKDVKVKNMTIGDLEKIKVNNVVIPSKDIGKSIHTSNPNMKQIRFTNFEKAYNETTMDKDIMGVFTSLNNKSLPMYVIKTEVKDTSDELNYKETWTVTLEDTLRNRHTITVDIPKFIDDKFLYIGGNKKLILKQNFFYPVVKIREGVVHIVTNENKMIMERIDNKMTSAVGRLNSLINSDADILKFFETGNAYVLNGKYITTVDYDDLSKKFMTFTSPNCKLFFVRSQAEEYGANHGVDITKLQSKNKFYVGEENKKPVIIDFDTQMTENSDQLIDIIIRNLPQEQQDRFRTTKAPKRLMYAGVTTMRKLVPAGLLMCYWEGIQTVMEKAGIEYRLTERFPKDLEPSEGTIRFADCYLTYKESVPKQLLMNGFRMIDTTKYKLVDFNTQDPYLEYFAKVYGKMSIVNPLMNTYEFTIDNITKEILETLNLPTNIVDLMWYAIQLMGDSRYLPEMNQTLSRVRSNEVVPAILYDAIAKNYVTYKNSNGKNKLSIQRDIVIRNLLSLKTVEDSSTLNPVLELERTHTVLQKGWRGINLDESYTIGKRSYDKSMVGIIGPTTSPDGAVGVQRVLSMEPKVTSVRGFTAQPSDIEELKDVNLFSPGELLIPISNTRDDSTRMGHAIKQSKHVVPTKNSAPVLISNGAEENCRFQLSSDFVVNAEEDGEVVEYDEKLKIVVCKYKSGKCRAIDLNANIVKNGGGGFYLSNILTTNLKLGQKFKKDDLLAYHKDFFTNNQNGARMNMGNLIKVALFSTYNTYEDSSFITHKLAVDAETEMCFNKKVVVGKNATVDYIAKVGDHINIGDTLIQFDTSFEDDELNKMLRTISDELKEGVLEDSRNDIKSKRAGVIEDIKIYSTVELEEMSPSLQKIVGQYYQTINKKKKLLEKYDPEGTLVKCGVLFNQTTKKISPNKYGVILGEKVEDSILFEFYIKHAEILEVGSKMAYYTGIKTVIGEVLPEGMEPYSEFRKDEEISSTISSNSILARMTPSIVLVTFGNKCLLELKRSLEDLYNSNKDLEKRKAEMTGLIYRFFTAFDKTGTNTKKYKDMFEPMSPNQFSSYFKALFADPKAYLILDIQDYENTIVMEDVERAAKVLKIPLFEHVYMPHLSMDKNEIVRTQIPVPVGYVHVKRTQQTVSKKNGISTSIDSRSAMTGQVTGSDKNGRESDLENIMLVSLGMTNTLKELNGPRADDMTMKRQMLTEIAEKGYVQLSELDDDVSNKTTLNTANVYLLGMGLNSDLVTKGLMLKSTIKEEL